MLELISRQAPDLVDSMPVSEPCAVECVPAIQTDAVVPDPNTVPVELPPGYQLAVVQEGSTSSKFKF